MEQEIMNVISVNGTATLKQIYSELEKQNITNKGLIRQALFKMHKAGKIKHDKRGEYTKGLE